MFLKFTIKKMYILPSGKSGLGSDNGKLSDNIV